MITATIPLNIYPIMLMISTPYTIEYLANYADVYTPYTIEYSANYADDNTPYTIEYLAKYADDKHALYNWISSQLFWW